MVNSGLVNLEVQIGHREYGLLFTSSIKRGKPGFRSVWKFLAWNNVLQTAKHSTTSAKKSLLCCETIVRAPVKLRTCTPNSSAISWLGNVPRSSGSTNQRFKLERLVFPRHRSFHFHYLFLLRDLLFFDITTQLIGISAHILERSAFRSRRGDPDIRNVSSRGAISEGIACHNNQITTPEPISIKGGDPPVFHINASNARR